MFVLKTLQLCIPIGEMVPMVQIANGFEAILSIVVSGFKSVVCQVVEITKSIHNHLPKLIVRIAILEGRK